MTTLLGVEALTAGELAGLGYARERVALSDGQVRLVCASEADAARAVARLNVNLRTAERVLLELGHFAAPDFDTLFDEVSQLPWEAWIAPDSAFHVNGYTRKSRLASVPACQALIKKAIVKRLLARRGQRPDSQLPEDEALGLLRIQFAIVGDQASLLADTSGDSLHKRGYRPLRHEAPIRETLAAAMLLASRYQSDRGEAVWDPFCGSGTIPIEAALMVLHAAPGIRRPFAAESWHLVGARAFAEAREEAASRITQAADTGPQVFGSDLDPRAVELAEANAQRAGAAAAVLFRQQDARQTDLSDLPGWTGFARHLVICNPPYGERSLDLQQAEHLYADLGRIFLDRGLARPGIRLSVISPHEGFERLAGGPADKRRKLYNGMIKCTLYHYFKAREMTQ
jgi:putative N6-adenine-specific DNA methylase